MRRCCDDRLNRGVCGPSRPTPDGKVKPPWCGAGCNDLFDGGVEPELRDGTPNLRLAVDSGVGPLVDRDTSLLRPVRPPPEVALVGGLASPVRHGEYYSSTHRTSQLNGLLDLLVSCSQLLRTREVRYRSRFAMKCQYEGQMHQLLRLCIQGTRGVGLLEVFNVALA